MRLYIELGGISVQVTGDYEPAEPRVALMEPAFSITALAAVMPDGRLKPLDVETAEAFFADLADRAMGAARAALRADLEDRQAGIADAVEAARRGT